MDTSDLPGELVNGDVSVVFQFKDGGPSFGDLFLITGEAHPLFTSTSAGAAYKNLSSLGFRQADDYFAVCDEDGEPTVWIYPMIDGYPVHQHSGPFHAIQIDFNLLSQAKSEIGIFLSVIERISQTLDVNAFWGDAREPLAKEALVPTVKSRIGAALQHWSEQGIEPGSDDARDISLE